MSSDLASVMSQKWHNCEVVTELLGRFGWHHALASLQHLLRLSWSIPLHLSLSILLHLSQVICIGNRMDESGFGKKLHGNRKIA